MIHAYDKIFLPDVQQNLGNAFHFAINSCLVDTDSFFDFFIASKVAGEIESGSPLFIGGCSGTELALTIFDRIGYIPKKADFDDKSIMYSRSQEYWAGWILAYYQWSTGIRFSKIRDTISLSQIVQMYHPLHEAPEEKFAETMDQIILEKSRTRETNLQRLRKLAGLTQKQLSELSGVNLRTLQQYETCAKDINMASGKAINALALALHCNFYDVMEL